jgi:IclR family transcriptional regulator, carbohydrate utilization repressor
MNDPTSASTSASTSTSIQVMSRMFALLDALADSSQAASLKHISAQTGLHPSTAHRILNDLAAGRYVERAGPGSYRLGLRLMELGNLVRARLDLKDEAIKTMLELHRSLGRPVSLYARQEHDCVPLVRTSQERHGLTIQRLPGQRGCVTDLLVGRSMMAGDTPAQIHHLCQKQGIRPESVNLDLQQIKQAGVLVGNEGANGVEEPCMAAPVYNDSGLVIGALSSSGIIGQNDAEILRQAALHISTQMGWIPETQNSL